MYLLILYSTDLPFVAKKTSQNDFFRFTNVALNVFGAMYGESISCNVFLLLFMVLWVPISAKLCRRAVLTLWQAFLFLGLRFSPFIFFLLGGVCCFFF
jgi:hypothetical protein